MMDASKTLVAYAAAIGCRRSSPRRLARNRAASHRLFSVTATLTRPTKDHLSRNDFLHHQFRPLHVLCCRDTGHSKGRIMSGCQQRPGCARFRPWHSSKEATYGATDHTSGCPRIMLSGEANGFGLCRLLCCSHFADGRISRFRLVEVAGSGNIICLPACACSAKRGADRRRRGRKLCANLGFITPSATCPEADIAGSTNYRVGE
jgi:hypothetical protein